VSEPGDAINMHEHALDRTEQFVGREGQATLRKLSIVVVGAGGLGTHVTQQLAFLRPGRLAIIDAGPFKESSRNRYIGSRHDDPVGVPKVELCKRLAHEIEPAMEVLPIHDTFVSEQGYEAIIAADYVFGCVDADGARLVLNELCSAYTRPYIDVATEIPADDVRRFGGRVCIAAGGKGCLYCLGVLDLDEARRQIGGPDLDRDHQRIYGVKAAALPGGGPAVVSINGVLASLAITEFLVWATGLREPNRLLSYRGAAGKVMLSVNAPSLDCIHCRGVFGRRESANVERYIAAGIGAWLR
jgi:hypothetical protein